MADVSGLPTGLAPRLVIPIRRDDQPRVSEQEARFLFCSLLNTLNYFYSVETPTTKTYQQTGATAQSALSDLSLYEFRDGKLEKVANVEFKAHNSTAGRIQKDIEKLIREGIPGNWFHIFRNADSGTLPALFDKFVEALVNCWHYVTEPLSILFCLTVLDMKWACLKRLDIGPGSVSTGALNDFFRLEYSVRGGQMIVSDKNCWSVVTLKGR